ncbi:MAG: hypothetical protein EOP04_03685 [Proteobacteria bacterium]|nr:MAG: hypothetical protein EOP04_03685 [Pseudomonadota bacterium]
MKVKEKFLLIGLFVLSSCRTLDPGAEEIEIIERSRKSCKNLGVVYMNWSVWGTSEESLNVLRNQTLEKGGNTLIMTGDSTGVAYRCPKKDN